MLYQALLLSCVLATAAAVVCDRDDECTQAQFCLDNKCEDPCKDGCGIPNTTCKVEFHRPVCSQVSMNVFNAYCCKDGECPKNQACVNYNCEDPCKGGCGVANTACKVNDHRPFCSCLPGYHGDPTTGCTSGCSEDGECPKNQACHNHKCEDPCKGGCGVNNTFCKVTDHRSFCYCLPSYHGDPAIGCIVKYKTTCQTLVTSGYRYDKFFHMTPGMNNADGSLFTVRFQVKTPSDAHILLSPRTFTDISEQNVYEIVLGCCENTKTNIRRRLGSSEAEEYTPNIVSGNEMRGFWVKVYQNGLIAAGKEGSDQPIIQWKESNLLDIHYLSFGSWTDVTANWLYNCPDINTTLE